MKVASGQFAVSRDWHQNQATVISLMVQALVGGADLLVLPESVLARDNIDPDWGVTAAQPLNGSFVTAVCAASRGNQLTTIMTVYVPNANGKVLNVLIALRDGEIIGRYDKLHLYDAFNMQESRNVVAGNSVPPLITVAGINVGLMTCYDIRFPELARRLVLDGADVLVLPAAWVKGALKEMHWELLVAARALENTCYMVAAGECGPRNIGNSLVVDPFGVIVARAAEAPALIFADIDPARLTYARSQLPVLQNRRFTAPELDKNTVIRPLDGV
ncbi:deaminated glutathione amidase [Erwinia tracheiphila]|uniref:Deaminated glutathione amidase n=1 Tax=Erwinia tracheiphila TaxID=65700 RepID=A0A345CP41_9GAMM|nr:deaminated glutathione amidase [Erwinia tracheiphila]AXF75208.1 deaminated glutathione amidase [Erwinia tracheiphila]UIA82244.1 deaminated glutathione amidase [Erwinia tracheiphila]UIA90841.1 deaminated glutathione amidase [Erwinia tracheiphila]